jgi:glycosyltransferase involved in cell wall biosynthesis
MRFGVYLGAMNPSGGGGFTFQESIINSLHIVSRYHNIFIFYKVGQDLFHSQQIKYIDGQIVNSNVLEFTSLLDATIENKIELIWFVTVVFEPINIPYISTVWDLQHRLQPFFPEVSVSGWTWEAREEFYRHVLPKATYILTGTKEGKKDIQRFYGISEEKVKVIPLPTPSFSLANHKYSNNAILKYRNVVLKDYIFYPAQFWPHKNHIALLYGLRTLIDEFNYTLHLVFSGSDHGNREYIEKAAIELNLRDRVFFLGFVSKEILITLYRNAFCMVFPSLFGPDNLPPLEAFGLGCPVIAANVPGSYEQLGDAALLFDGTNDRDIALCIKSLIEDKTIRDNLITNGLKRAQSWTSDDYVHALIDIINTFHNYRRCWSSDTSYLYQIKYNEQNPELIIINTTTDNKDVAENIGD